MGHRWTHPQCERCWVDANTDDEGRVRVPTRMLKPEQHICCFCGYPTWAGIWVRADGSKLPLCSGKDGAHD